MSSKKAKKAKKPMLETEKKEVIPKKCSACGEYGHDRRSHLPGGRLS
jgi:hypothetical protein